VALLLTAYPGRLSIHFKAELQIYENLVKRWLPGKYCRSGGLSAMAMQQLPGW